MKESVHSPVQSRRRSPFHRWLQTFIGWVEWGCPLRWWMHRCRLHLCPQLGTSDPTPGEAPKLPRSEIPEVSSCSTLFTFINPYVRTCSTRSSGDLVINPFECAHLHLISPNGQRHPPLFAPSKQAWTRSESAIWEGAAGGRRQHPPRRSGSKTVFGCFQ